MIINVMLTHSVNCGELHPSGYNDNIYYFVKELLLLVRFLNNLKMLKLTYFLCFFLAVCVQRITVCIFAL